jgi:hypothetical protein
MGLVAVGYPGWPPAATVWDWWPIVGIALTLWIAFAGLHVRFRPGILLLAIAVGPVFASLVHGFGVAFPIGTVVCLRILLSLRGTLGSR